MKRKIKVLEVNKLYTPQIGGIETIVQNIAENLKHRANIKVLVCQPKGKTVKEWVNGVFVIRCASFGTVFSMPLSLCFFSYFRKLSKTADLIHIHVPFPLADLACLLSGYQGKVVVSWHSDIVRQKKILLVYKPLLNWLIRRADCIVAATQEHIDSSPFIRPYAEKCRIIPYGLNIEEYRIKGTVLTDRLNRKTYVKALFVGRLVYYKGIGVLLQAMKRVKGCELFLVGSGKKEKDWKESAKEIKDRVHFLGALSSEDLKKAFSDCDFLVLPSVEKSESFGIVQLEAMVYGKPVINTALPTGVPSVSLDGITGITVKAGNEEELAKAMQCLVDQKELREQYGANAKKRVENHFNNQMIMKQMLELYQSFSEKEKREGKED